eukprot:15338316-Ditylum_brightwellii.AAC.1
MKINLKSLKSDNYSVRNRPLPILFYILEKKEKLSPSDYQVYKLWINSKDKKLAVYSLTDKHYEVGTLEEWLQFINVISQIIKGHSIMDLEMAYTG